MTTISGIVSSPSRGLVNGEVTGEVTGEEGAEAIAKGNETSDPCRRGVVVCSDSDRGIAD